MTYKELLKQLNRMSSDRLEDTATIYDPYTDEYVAVVDTRIADKDVDVLDEGHLYLIMKA